MTTKIHVVVSYSDGVMKAFWDKQKAHEYADKISTSGENFMYPQEDLYIAGVEFEG